VVIRLAPIVAAIVASALAPITSAAEPFLSIPRLPTELRRDSAGALIAPAGWDLGGSDSASWGVTAVTSAAGIHGVSAAGARSLAGLRVQVSASDFGVSFYARTGSPPPCR